MTYHNCFCQIIDPLNDMFLDSTNKQPDEVLISLFIIVLIDSKLIIVLIYTRRHVYFKQNNKYFMKRWILKQNRWANGVSTEKSFESVKVTKALSSHSTADGHPHYKLMTPILLFTQLVALTELLNISRKQAIRDS